MGAEVTTQLLFNLCLTDKDNSQMVIERCSDILSCILLAIQKKMPHKYLLMTLISMSKLHSAFVDLVLRHDEILQGLKFILTESMSVAEKWDEWVLVVTWMQLCLSVQDG